MDIRGEEGEEGSGDSVNGEGEGSLIFFSFFSSFFRSEPLLTNLATTSLLFASQLFPLASNFKTCLYIIHRSPNYSGRYLSSLSSLFLLYTRIIARRL